MKRHTNIGLGITAAWGLVCAGLFRWRFEDIYLMTLNEWGDLLAGLAAPLALFWVVIGYFQHGEELRLNTKALELQQKELRHQVEETATLARNAERQAKASEGLTLRETMAAQPDIEVESWGSGSGSYDYTFRLTNSGASATEIKFHYEGPHDLVFEPKIDRWNTNQGADLHLRLVRDNDPEFPIRFRFEYTDRLQEKRTREGELSKDNRITFKKLDLTQAGA